MGRAAEIPHRHAARMASGALISTTRRDRDVECTNHKPPSGLRTDLTVSAESARRLGWGKPRCAPDGGTAENASVTRERVDAEDGDLRACPSVDRSATPRLLEKTVRAQAKLGRAKLGKAKLGKESTAG